MTISAEYMNEVYGCNMHWYLIFTPDYYVVYELYYNAAIDVYRFWIHSNFKKRLKYPITLNVFSGNKFTETDLGVESWVYMLPKEDRVILATDDVWVIAGAILIRTKI